jgi:Asp-tRNA(Asn)/Glu-tRNA(Gln) amidotransferase C subunit
MNVTQKELSHLIFLADVVMNGKKKTMMEETLHCLIYIVKSIQEIELPDNVVEQMNLHIEKIEEQLRSENDRLQEIQHNLYHPSQRKPLGK